MGKKIAYLILVHSDPGHLARLVKALTHPCDIYIHVDSKSDISTFNAIIGKKKNIVLLQHRTSVSWAGISMIDAQILLMLEALKKENEYSHIVFLSGSCYPIKDPESIFQLFDSNPEKEFIRFIDMRESPNFYMNHIERKHFKEPWTISGNRFIRLTDKVVRRGMNLLRLRNRWNSKVIPYFGSQWCALTMKCCQYIMKYLEENPWFRDMNRYTFSPDEHFIHTIIGNSPLLEKSDGVQPYQGRGTWRMANLHLIDPSLQKWYTLNDWTVIKDSDKLFVRKIRSLDGSELLDRIDRELLGFGHQ